MATTGDLAATSHKISSKLAFTTTENRGGSGLLHKFSKNQGGNNTWQSLSSGAPFQVDQTWKAKREPVTVTQTFQQGEVPKQVHNITWSPVGPVAATGQNLFITPPNRSYRVTNVRETHNVAESTAATLNLKAERLQLTEAAAAGNDLIAATAIDLKAAANTVQAYKIPRIATTDLDVLVDSGDRLGVHFAVDAGTATASTEYEGNATFTLEPILRSQNDIVTVNFPITAETDLAATGVTIFTCTDTPMEVLSIEEVHTVAEATAATCNLKVERCQGTEAATAGDDLLGATNINMKGTANTRNQGTLEGAPGAGIRVLKAADRLVIHAANDAAAAVATNEYAGVVTVRLRPMAAAITEEFYVVGYVTNALAATGVPIYTATQPCRVTDIMEVHSVAESTAATANVMIERCQGTEAAGAGDDLLAIADIDAKGTANTVQTFERGDIVTTGNRNLLSAGDRLVWRFTNDGGTAIATTEYDGCVVIRCEPIPARGPLNMGQIFQADGKAYKVQSVEATWGTAEVEQSQCNLYAERLQGVEALGNGDRLIGLTDVDLTGTINTVGAGTVVSSGNEILANGDRLAVYCTDDAGFQVAPSNLDDLTVTVKLLGQADGIEPAKEGEMFTAIGRTFLLVNAEATWQTAESTATQCNLILERLQGTEAAGGASGGNGDRLIGLTDIDCTGTAGTVNTGTIVTTSDVNQITDGDRIAINFVNDAGTTTIVPTELDGLHVTLYLVPATLEAAASS